MDRLTAYTMFRIVAELSGFSAAARHLGTSPQAVTRGVAALEAQLGVTLFHRSTRAVALTADGAALLPRIRRLLDELAEAERSISGAQIEPRGPLHVTAPVTFGRLHVLPVVTRLLAQHPLLEVRLLLLDRNVRIIEEGIDVAVRIGPLADSALRALQIGDVRQVLVASPGYIAMHGAPASPVELANHALIAFTGPRASTEWRFIGHREVPVRARLSVNTVAAVLDAVESGAGIANLLSYQVADAIASGRLVEVLGHVAPTVLPVNLVFEPGRGESAATRAFIAAMRESSRAGSWD